MKLGLGLGFVPSTIGETTKPIYSQTNGAPATFDAAAWNPEGFTMIGSFTRTGGADNYPNFEVQLYAGTNNVQNRVHYGINNDATRISNVIVEKNDTESLRGTYNLRQRFLAETMKYALTYDGTIFTMYMNGFKFVMDDDVVIPTNIDGISVGRYPDGTFQSIATSIDFEYYDRAISEAVIRNKTRNSQLLSAFTGNSNYKAIVFAGQSNAVGAYTGEDEPEYTNTDKMKMLTYAGLLGDYADPFANNTNNLILDGTLGSSSSGVGYAGYLIDKLAGETDDTYVAVSAAQGSTSFGGGEWTAFIAASPNADQIINQRPSALIHRALMARQAVGGKPVGLTIWHLGETDANLGTSKAVYKEQWQELFHEYMAAVGSHPVIVVGIHDDVVASGADITAIQEAIEELADENNNVYFVDIADIDGASGDANHFDLAGYEEIANRIKAVIDANGAL